MSRLKIVLPSVAFGFFGAVVLMLLMTRSPSAPMPASMQDRDMAVAYMKREAQAKEEQARAYEREAAKKSMAEAKSRPMAPPPAKHKQRSGGGLGGQLTDNSIPVDFGDDTVAGDLIAPARSPESPAEPAVRQRSWFPETFLFEPLVVTDANGHAAVPVRVPDRLTSWRVLALAHSREGAQAGAATSFASVLPAYVDPVVPNFLMAGDELRLPVQVVNTTDDELQRALRVEAAGGSLVGMASSVRVGPRGTRVEYGTLKAARPGTLAVKATLGGTDQVQRAIQVWPTGRYVEARKSGTLAAPRTVELAGAHDLDADSAKLRLTVYPGALAVLRSELGAAVGRGGVAEDAYALLLAGRAPELIRSLGDVPDTAAVRGLSLTAGQRAIRHARSPSLWSAALIAEAASARPDDAVLSRLAQRMAEQVARKQRPDGTFAGEDGWTAQRLLVATAECVRSLRAAAAAGEANGVKRDVQRAAAATLRASGAFERHFGRVEDAYTAAAILASGAVTGPLADKLRERVRNAVRSAADGSRTLPVEKGVVRPSGEAPSEIEATALAALALEGDPKAPWRADLGAALLAAYSPRSGWGDGRTNLVALRAVVSLFKERLPDKIRIVLEMDGKPIREGLLDARNVRDTLVLDAPAPRAAGAHTYAVRAEPPVAGLGYALSLQTWVPWKIEPSRDGLELAISAGTAKGAFEAKRGAPLQVTVEAAAPSGVPLRIRHALPAGAQPDATSLDALASSGAITSWSAEEGAVTLAVPARAPGESFRAAYRVVPTLAGKLRSGPSSIAIASRNETAHVLPPQLWTIADEAVAAPAARSKPRRR